MVLSVGDMGRVRCAGHEEEHGHGHAHDGEHVNRHTLRDAFVLPEHAVSCLGDECQGVGMERDGRRG
jgi:hypothetical protein